MAEMVALVAVDAALASAERRRRSSLPLPLHASEYVRRAAVHEMLWSNYVSFGFVCRQRRQTRACNGRGGCGCSRRRQRPSTRLFAFANAFAALWLEGWQATKRLAQ
eukprot:819203-Pleurochrysis_carterae.AAC.2